MASTHPSLEANSVLNVNDAILVSLPGNINILPSHSTESGASANGVVQSLSTTESSGSSYAAAPPAKRPRHNSVSSSISNSGSSSSSKTETKSSVTTLASEVKTQQLHTTNTTPSDSLMSTKATSVNSVRFNWPVYLEKEGAVAASVSFFKHVPLKINFDHFTDNFKVEVENRYPPPADILTLNDKFRDKPYYWYSFSFN